eukprot:g24040.t1
MPLPEGAFSGFFGSALMPPNEETAGRFCTEGPKLEFGGPISQADAGAATRVPLRQFAQRLQSAIAQAATLLVDRHLSLTRQSSDFTPTQDEEMIKLSYGVQAASYNVQKWAFALGHGDGPPFRPPPPQTVEEALAMMNMSLPRLVDEGLAVSYILKGPSMKAAYSLCFEDKSTAGNFVRDFRVRSRLMDMSLKTVRGRAAAQDLRKDLESMKQRSLAARACRALRLLFLVATLLLAARAAHLFSQNSERQPMEYLSTIGEDISGTLHLSASATSTAGTKACDQCAAQLDDPIFRTEEQLTGVRSCIRHSGSGWVATVQQRDISFEHAAMHRLTGGLCTSDGLVMEALHGLFLTAK